MNKKEILFLSGVISEEQFIESKEEGGLKHYMFFSNLKTIKDKVDIILKMNPKMIDSELGKGHDWASDHITSSRDDIEEVFYWIPTRIKSK